MAASGEQILIVESDPDISDLIARQTLQPLGYKVTVATDAGDAIKQALRNPPDLILVNLNLSGLSGKDLLVALSSQGIKAPLIVIAQKGQETDAIQAFRLGAFDTVFWPARDAEIVAAVERVLQHTQEIRARQKLDLQLKQIKEQYERNLRNLSTILMTGKAVISAADQRKLFEQILQSALQVAEADVAWFTLRDEPTKTFLLKAHRNLPEAWAKKVGQPLDDGISSLVALSAESLVMSGAPLQKFKVATLGKSAGVIPVKVQNEVIGLLIVVRKADREIERNVQSLLEALADYASIALINARLFQALQKTAESSGIREKQRLAALDSLRTAIRTEIQNAGYPLNLVLTEMPGAVNQEQRHALESVQAALQRLSHASEKTSQPQAINKREEKS